MDVVVKRSEAGKNYGVVMLPEGLIEFIPEFDVLISDINEVLASGIPPTIGERPTVTIEQRGSLPLPLRRIVGGDGRHILVCQLFPS